MYITVVSQIDLCYPCMQISGYVSCPNEPIFMVLHQTMQYLFHHLHLLIMYPSKEKKKDGNALTTHWGKGKAKFLPSSFGDGLVNFNKANHACNLQDHRSISFSVHLLNGVAISWKCKKQPDTALHLTGAEIHALFSGAKKTKILCQFSASIGFPVGPAMPMMEDNQSTIKCVKAT